MVITLDRHKKPLGFCTERRVRILMEKGRACICRYYPFTIIVKDIDVRDTDPTGTYRLKIDPGSKTTGMAVVCNETNEVMLYMQIGHRGDTVKENLDTRRMTRRNRRQRETRYRRPKWSNKTPKKNSKQAFDTPRPEGWLPPSVKSVADNILSWTDRLRKLIRVTECSFEAARFDTQLMDNPNIESEEYQQGTLMGYEIREYLLDKYGHVCQYCGGASGDAVLEWEHIVPKAKGGSDKAANATLSCHACNQAKGSKTLKEWRAEENAIANGKKGSKKRKELAKARMAGIDKVLAGKPNSVPDRYCAWVNSSRRYVEKGLFDRFEDVECASGGRTKHNRIRLGLPKDHHYDALCVGEVPEDGYRDRTGGYCLHIRAMGRGTRMRGQINACGIITVRFRERAKRRFGFQTGDIVAADVPNGRYAGRHVGRVMTRNRPSFDIRCTDGSLATARPDCCRILQRDSGYRFRMAKDQNM